MDVFLNGRFFRARCEVWYTWARCHVYTNLSGGAYFVMCIQKCIQITRFSYVRIFFSGEGVYVGKFFLKTDLKLTPSFNFVLIEEIYLFTKFDNFKTLIFIRFRTLYLTLKIILWQVSNANSGRASWFWQVKCLFFRSIIR